MLNTVYIGLGSNLDQPLQQVTQALEEINAITGTTLVSHSPWYKSTAVGPIQPDFINGVAKAHTSLDAHRFLTALQAIEQAHQRVRKEHWGPRTLDLDILLWNNDTIATERLTVPHAFMTERGFVLLPLNDIASELSLPNGTPLKALVQQCDQTGIEQI
ncbi:2-amino-4-hydroxy-6-hydroxymethyldihydropteridine diphosphokinase [Marinagarivorans algicola]|uniref:2-amino-4-hydroxy-6- hydroxymethyldihydropteridine diphosphokinase n=1 Tax=Marinagarivorans algicola TaxID=1513270 RepID=UPI0006B5CB6B|nr:2-amino-4-hydroxy-6-hydroxymethyldihydropteridine diphosphokinase [Marinagarivorans algicola]